MHVHSLWLSSRKGCKRGPPKSTVDFIRWSKIERTPEGERDRGEEEGEREGGIDFTRWTRHLSTSSRRSS